MAFRKYITNSFALQTTNLLRFITFFVISILLVKSGYSKKNIGEFEMALLLANAASFFWVYGIIYSLMTLYNNNNTFLNSSRNRKSPEIFNSFLLLIGMSCFVLIIFLLFKNHLNLFGVGLAKFPYFSVVILYILFTNPACLIEYIYVLRNKPMITIIYGILTYTIIFASVCIPLMLGNGIQIALWCLTGTSIFRFIWLLVLLKKYAKFHLSFIYIKEQLKLAFPLILSNFLSGSAEYIDNIIISLKFNFESVAVFRYGAKELPFSSGMANGLSGSLISEFSTPEKIDKSIAALKKKSKRLMHILFPISILILGSANFLYPILYSSAYNRSADIFMLYLLLITSRLLFPHTILIGLKLTRVVLWASSIAIIFNIVLSIIFSSIPDYGTIGVALATVVVYFLEKVGLMFLVYYRCGIKPARYTPIYTYLMYSLILVALFVLIDRRIIVL